MIDPRYATAGSVYSIIFTPYGTGPQRNTLVVKIETSAPVRGVKKAFALAGRNIVLDASQLRPGQVPVVGGSYSGTIRLEPRDGLLAPTLITASKRLR
jgi:hypothetical protein